MGEPAKHPLTAYRDEKGITLDALGDELGVHKSTLSRWENGEVPVPVNRLPDIERITGLNRRALRPDIFAEAAE